MKEVIQKLEQSNLRKTAIRKEVLQLFLKAKGNALSSRDIESQLENPDRITLYRTLRTFEEKGLIHRPLMVVAKIVMRSAPTIVKDMITMMNMPISIVKNAIRRFAWRMFMFLLSTSPMTIS